MANLAKVERCWRELTEVLETPRTNHAGHLHQLGGRPQGLLRRARRHRAPRPTPAPSPSGPSSAARKCCSSPTSTWAAGPATTWASRWTRWWSGTRTSNSAA
jgi:hypothetical protein